MSRICMRPGCDRDAAARLTYDPVGCEVWLDDLAERVGRSQEICVLHAERLTVPRGWVLSDRRADEPPMFAPPALVSTPTPEVSAPPVRRRRRRSTGEGHPANQTLELFEVLRQELAQAEADAVAAVEPQAAPAAEPEVGPAVEPAVVPTVEPAVATAPPGDPVDEVVDEAIDEVPAADAEPDQVVEPDPEELPESLKATSPLLSRAFAATGHQRSVLTQPSPPERAPD